MKHFLMLAHSPFSFQTFFTNFPISNLRVIPTTPVQIEMPTFNLSQHLLTFYFYLFLNLSFPKLSTISNSLNPQCLRQVQSCLSTPPPPHWSKSQTVKPLMSNLKTILQYYPYGPKAQMIPIQNFSVVYLTYF